MLLKSKGDVLAHESSVSLWCHVSLVKCFVVVYTMSPEGRFAAQSGPTGWLFDAPTPGCAFFLPIVM